MLVAVHGFAPKIQPVYSFRQNYDEIYSFRQNYDENIEHLQEEMNKKQKVLDEMEIVSQLNEV